MLSARGMLLGGTRRSLLTKAAIITVSSAILSANFQTGVYSENGVSYAIGALPGFAFGNTSGGFAVDASGGLHSFAVNVPRITTKGLLLETAATNLSNNSNDFTNTGQWNYSGAVTMATGQTDPTGGTGATKVTFAAGSQGSIALQGPFLNLVSGQSYVVSIWAQSATGAAQTFAFNYFNGSSSVALADITVGTTYQRYYTTFVASATSSFSLLEIVGGAAGAAFSINMYEYQPESGTVPSSNIHTTSATVTRAADTLVQTLSGTLHNMTVVYTGGSASSTPTSPITLDSSGGGAWIGQYIQQITVT